MLMRNISILKANNVFWKDYKNLRLRALREEPKAFASSYEIEKNTPDEEWKKRLKSYKEGKNNWMVFANDAGKLVGMVGAYQTDRHIKNNSVDIIALFVPGEERGRGISKLLMRALLDELKNASISNAKLSVYKEQVIALNLYKKLGFKITGQENVPHGTGEPHKAYLMEKTL